MRERSRLLARNTGRFQFLQRVARVVLGIAFGVLVPSKTTQADDNYYSVVAKIESTSAGLTQGEVVVRVGNVIVPTTAIKASPDIPRNIAIVIDAGPDQAKVLSKERELAVALINELSAAGTSF